MPSDRIVICNYRHAREMEWLATERKEEKVEKCLGVEGALYRLCAIS